MTSSGSVHPARHQSPLVVGGQRRRRITRRPQMPRPNTAPALIPESVSLQDGLGARTTDRTTDQTELSIAPSSSEPFPSMISSMPNRSPAPSIGSTPSVAWEGKKKHGMFGLKTKDIGRPKSSHGSPHQLSPLPPLTPVKAAQVLGVDSSASRPRSSSLGSRVQNSDKCDGLLDFTSRKDKLKEDGGQTDPHKSKGFWETSNKKAQKMLGLLPSRGSSTKHQVDLEPVVPESPEPHAEEGKTYYSSEPDLHVCPHLRSPAARPVSGARRRRMRKKAPKSLDRMTPITEASHDELRSFYNCESNTELELITEYEHESSSHNAPNQPHTPPLHTAIARYALDEGDLSPTDVALEDDAVTEDKEPTVHPGNQVDFKKLDYQQPTVVYLRGPLQTVEDRLLDATEARLAALRIKQKNNDAARLVLDTENITLRTSHEKMKAEFTAMNPGMLPEEPVSDGESESDDEDLFSIRSSIDLEEPTVHIAKAMTFTRVTPGMVKLVDIPPRKQKPATSPEHKPLLALSDGTNSSFKPTYYFEHNEKISPFNERSRNVEPTAMPGHLTMQNYNRIHKVKKPKLPREESQMLVQNWISMYDHTKQRPLSERLDVDVLADQQIPPAPFPKEDHTTPTRPPRTSSKEHYCLRNGHIFHPINLKNVPDEVAINRLQVRPYLHTHVGRKQHVHVPVFCDRCDEDVKEELWECDIAVCNMVVCKECAVDMDLEWQERVIAAWEH
ncbi:hypothetical protein ACJQWK_04350 [Exserohilum turcicum]